MGNRVLVCALCVQVLAAREHQAEFWAELALKSPSLARLDSIGLSIARAMNGAEESFKRLLRLNPNSVPVMRRFSQFLAEVRTYFTGHLYEGSARVVVRHSSQSGSAYYYRCTTAI